MHTAWVYLRWHYFSEKKFTEQFRADERCDEVCSVLLARGPPLQGGPNNFLVRNWEFLNITGSKYKRKISHKH